MKLYLVEITDYPAAAVDVAASAAEEIGFYLDMDWRPDGWLADPEQRAAWIARHGDDRFFWPKAGLIYKSRSAAQARVDLIESYGATAVVLVTETSWQTLDAARAERERDRRSRRIADLRARIARLEAQ